MKDLVIQPDDSRAAQAGDFGAEFASDRLLLPGPVVKHLRARGVVTARELVSFTEAFPSAVAQALGWSLPDVRRASVGFEATLQRVLGVSATDLHPEHPRVGMGALDPKFLKP